MEGQNWRHAPVTMRVTIKVVRDTMTRETGQQERESMSGWPSLQYLQQATVSILIKLGGRCH